MSEISEQPNMSALPESRPPVVWKIAMVKDESRSVTVVFPMSPNGADGDTQGTGTRPQE